MTTRRPRLILFFLFCLAPVLLGVTGRYGEGIWLAPAGVLPLLLLGPTRIILWSLVTAAAYWIGLRLYASALKDAEWRARWLTVRGLLLLSLPGIGGVVLSFVGMSYQWGIFAPGWWGAAAVAWGLHLLTLTRELNTESRGEVLLLRLWLVATLPPSGYAFLFGTLAGLCC